MAQKPTHVMKCPNCKEFFLCPSCEEAENDKYHYYIYKKQLLDAKETKYLNSIKNSQGLFGGGWLYHNDNFKAIIKGKFTEDDIDCVLRGLKDLGKNKILAASIKKKLLQFYKGRKG